MILSLAYEFKSAAIGNKDREERGVEIGTAAFKMKR